MVKRRSLLILAVSIAALATSGVLWAVDRPAAADAALIAAAVVPLAQLVAGIVRELRQARPGVDVIALLAIGGALALGELLTAAIVGLMLATGQFLDEYAAGRAERELTALLERAPRFAHRLRFGELETIAASEVVVGDRLMVKAGEIVPVDGIVSAGPAILDEAALTGEPLPVERAQGDLASSGAVNAAAAFQIQAVATAADSTYEGIIRLVRSAQESRAPAVRLADRWAGWFVPLALALAGIAWAVSGDPVRALAVLVVATPCPLLLAVPIAIVSGVSRGARRGIIFRGGGPLEMLARADILVFDKTGTVTVGEPTLRSVTAFADVAEPEVLRLAASVDQGSSHVLARAIVGAAQQRGLELSLPDSVMEVPGAGVSGTVEGVAVSVGNAAWLLESRAETDEIADFRRRMGRVAPMTIFVAIGDAVVGAVLFDDVVRPDAARAIRGLRRAGIERVVMATGDHPVVAQSVGLAIGIDTVLAECTPSEKVDAVRDLSGEGVTVMVGDGINDAPALAAAHVGVAMGARGATASSEAADVVLMVDQLNRLLEGIRIAQRSRSIALQSVIIGMGLSLVAMGFATVGLLPPILGAITQEFIDVIAIVNALRALGDGRTGNGQPTLSSELSRKLRAEHDDLMPRLDAIRDTADRLVSLDGAAARAELLEVQRFLRDEILPHEREDERKIYPEIAERIGGDDPLATMSRSHREIFHLIDALDRTVDDLPSAGPEPADLRDLHRLLYGLHAVLRLHFEQEEELYASLDENYAEARLGR